MNQEIKQKWISALRSGEYRQGNNVLRSADNKFCCLGVLCDAYHKETGLGEWILETDSNRYRFRNSDGTTDACLLGKQVAVWAGLPDNDSINVRVPGFRHKSLTGLNDAGHSFEEIAKVIEEHL